MNRYLFLILGALLCSAVSYFLAWFILHDLVLQKLLDPTVYKNTVAVVIRDHLIPWGVFVFSLYQTFKATSITLPPGHKGVLLFLEERKDLIFDEGLNWCKIPMVLGLLPVNVQIKTMEVTVLNAISKDRVTVKRIALKIQYAIKNVYQSTNVSGGVEAALRGLVESEIRSRVPKLSSFMIPRVTRDIADSVQSGFDMEEVEILEEGKSPSYRIDRKVLTDVEKVAQGESRKSFTDEAAQWGVGVEDIFITEVELPQDVVEAMNQERKERSEKTAQEIEAGNIVGLFERLKETGLSPERIQQTVHAIVGKAQPSFFIDGSAGELTRGLAVLAGMAKPQKQGGE